MGKTRSFIQLRCILQVLHRQLHIMDDHCLNPQFDAMQTGRDKTVGRFHNYRENYH